VQYYVNKRVLKTTAISIKFLWIPSDTIGVQGTTVLFVVIQATLPQDMPLPRNKHGALHTKLHKHVTAS